MGWKQKIPKRELLGKYESWLVVMKGGSCMRTYDRVLDKFLGMFPNVEWIEDYSSVHLTDYVTLRKQQGASDKTMQFELNIIRGFWKWMIEDKGLRLSNPARAFKLRVKGTYKYVCKNLSLDEVNRIITACENVEHKKYILDMMRGAVGTPHTGKKRQAIIDAAHRAGFPNFAPVQLKMYLRSGLAKDIIEAYCAELLKALSPGDQCSSSTPATSQPPEQLPQDEPRTPCPL
jgi:hypothetical protein